MRKALTSLGAKLVVAHFASGRRKSLHFFVGRWLLETFGGLHPGSFAAFWKLHVAPLLSPPEWRN